MDIQNFITEFKKTFVYDMLKDYVSDEKLFDHVVEGTKVIWMKEQTRQMWTMWQAAKASVAEGFVLVDKSKIESWYLDDYEGMYTDEPDNFLSELDIGDVQAVKRKDYLIIDERTLYAARPWNKNDEAADCWEFYESKDEADLVAENCLKNWNGDEAQEPAK